MAYPQHNRNVQHGVRNPTFQTVQGRQVNYNGDGRSAHSTVPDLTGQIVYDLRSPIGAGGYGSIYLGKWTRQQDVRSSNVVVKVLGDKEEKRNIPARLHKRLRREVHAWHGLDNPYIVRLLGVAFVNDRPAIVMPYYANGDASRYLQSINASLEMRVKIVKDLCKAVMYLHNKPRAVVHGDIKAQNVLITNEGRGVLADFGLARIIEDLNRKTGLTTTSTPSSDPWAAPEIHAADDETYKDSFSFASDVWAFACTAYELMTGKGPFYRQIRHSRNGFYTYVKQGGRPEWEENGRPLCGASRHLRALLDRCWAKEPSQRPSIVTVHAELDALRY